MYPVFLRFFCWPIVGVIFLPGDKERRIQRKDPDCGNRVWPKRSPKIFAGIAQIHLKSLICGWKNDREKIREPSDSGIIGDFSQISSICGSSGGQDRCRLDERGEAALDQLLDCRYEGWGLRKESLSANNLKQSNRGLSSPSSLIFANGFRRSQIIKQLKRYFDIALLLTLIFSFPCLLRFRSRLLGIQSPIFYRQERVGQDGRIFALLKFRSMRVDAKGQTGLAGSTIYAWPCGKDIRKLRLDEIPQVINVLKEKWALWDLDGKTFLTEKLTQEIPSILTAHGEPGITGWAQICYPMGHRTGRPQ